MSDLFETMGASPMLIGAERSTFDDENYLYELKLDGVRCLAYLDKGRMELQNKRNLRVAPIYPELAAINKRVKSRCILDGELIVMQDGKPNFAEIQRRALMSDPFKIQMAAAKLPVSFTAFDILYLKNEEVMDRPLYQRKELLSEVVRENDRIAVSRYLTGTGVALFQLTEQNGLEGVVAKRRDSFYYCGKRTKDWIKSKNLQDDDFVLCGYIHKSKGVVSLVLGQYSSEGGRLLYKGHVTLGVSGGDFERIASLETIRAPGFEELPKGNERAVWVTPKLVGTVKYMERTASGSLRQPVFKGIRDDKRPEECKVQA